MTVKEAMDRLEDKVEKVAGELDADRRRELSALIETLREEVETLASTHREDAESIAGYTRASLQEAARDERNPKLLQHSIDGLATSVESFETSHGKLVQTVNGICTMLSNIGI